MAHSPIRDLLIALANNNSSDAMGFLEGLGDVHVEWHGEVVRTYGFLLFHHRIVRSFNSIVNPVLEQPAIAFTADDFSGMDVPNFDENQVNGVNDLRGLATFSSVLESWHNTAHVRIGTATGAPMLDTRQNVLYYPFWRLHLYVESLFLRILSQYGNQIHPGQFLNLPAIAAHLEASHHGWVPRI